MKIKRLLLGALLGASILLQSTAYAAVGDQGVDWSRYQGANGVFGYSHDKFAICQIGGVNGGGIYGVNQRMRHKLHQRLHKASVLILTFGTKSEGMQVLVSKY